MGTATLAKKKSVNATGDGPDDIVIMTIKCRREWRDWALDLARAERAPLATLIDQLLTERARERGLPEPPARGKE
jgi:hypothetical protein